MSDERMNVLVYSDNAETRRAVIEGVGRRAAKDLPLINWVETASGPGTLLEYADAQPDLLILDAESTKVGGMSVARSLQDRYDDFPPIVLLTARPQDDWLAKWAGAQSVVAAPLDPLELQEAVSGAARSAR